MSFLVECSDTHCENFEARPVSIWRRREWHLWREQYLAYVPEERRGAWVHQPNEVDPSASKCQVAHVVDMSLGSIKIRTRCPYETGAVIQVDVWDEDGAEPLPVRVRVLCVAKPGRTSEWLHSCAFLHTN